MADPAGPHPIARRGRRGHALAELLRAELGAGILGLRLYMACVLVSGLLLGLVWMLGNGLIGAIADNGRAILGGDVAVEVEGVPLSADRERGLSDIGALSKTMELTSTVRAGERRVPAEVKAVDGAYPLYGRVELQDGEDLAAALARGAVVEQALLTRLGVAVGDEITLGNITVPIAAILLAEPDRLSSGRFLVGPRVLLSMDTALGAGVLGPGALVEHRYRLRFPEDADGATLIDAVRALEPPERGWDMRVAGEAADRVLETVERTTTFLGVAGVVAMAIGLAGTWSAALVWVTRRARTVALYRLSGASRGLMVALHAAILGLAGGLAILLGLVLASLGAAVLVGMVTERLHLDWQSTRLIVPALEVAAVMALGLAGACLAALSAAGQIAPGQAMRGGDATLSPRRVDVASGLGIIALAILIAVVRLPAPELAALAATGLVAATMILALSGFGLSRLARGMKPRGFMTTAIGMGLSDPAAMATRAVAIGLGIAGITAILTAQSSFQTGLRAQLPEQLPDVVLIDVQPAQLEPVRARIAADPALFGVQDMPNMRARILAVNGVPAADALVDPEKSWVIEGDRSFSWAAEPTGAELLQGEWWPEDYTGSPLLSPEEDVYEAFDLKVGDTITYSVLGRSFTSPVTNIRKEYHRTFRPEFLMLASPEPFRTAPHSWIMSLQGANDEAVDGLLTDLATLAPNVTGIDIRRIVAQVEQVVAGATLGTLAIAAAMLFGGILTLGAVVSGDIDARRREAVAFALIGVSRRELAQARLLETAATGVATALIGGVLGNIGGYWLVAEALRVDWTPGAAAWAVPLALSLLAVLTAAIAGGFGSLPRARGSLARILAG